MSDPVAGGPAADVFDPARERDKVWPAIILPNWDDGRGGGAAAKKTEEESLLTKEDRRDDGHTPLRSVFTALLLRDRLHCIIR